MVEGKLVLARHPTELLQAEPLRSLAQELRDDPESDAELDADLKVLLDSSSDTRRRASGCPVFADCP